jgi:hypothetical protein
VEAFWTTEEVEEVVAVLVPGILLVFEVVVFDGEVVDVFGVDEVLLIVALGDEVLVVGWVLVVVPLVELLEVVVVCWELVVVTESWDELEALTLPLTVEVEVVLTFWLDELALVVEEVLMVLDLVTLGLAVELWDVDVDVDVEVVRCKELVVVLVWTRDDEVEEAVTIALVVLDLLALILVLEGEVEVLAFWDDVDGVLVVEWLVVAAEPWDVDVEVLVECRELVVALEVCADEVEELLALLPVLVLLVAEVLTGEVEVEELDFLDDEALLLVVLVDEEAAVEWLVLVVLVDDLATLVLIDELWDVVVDVVLGRREVLEVCTRGDEDEEALTLVLIEVALLVLEVLIVEGEVEVEDVFGVDEVLLVVERVVTKRVFDVVEWVLVIEWVEEFEVTARFQCSRSQ